MGKGVFHRLVQTLGFKDQATLEGFRCKILVRRKGIYGRDDTGKGGRNSTPVNTSKRNGSLLDDDNLQLIAEMAEEAGAQVWIERVGEGEEAQVIIEDGYVKGEGPAQEEAA